MKLLLPIVFGLILINLVSAILSYMLLTPKRELRRVGLTFADALLFALLYALGPLGLIVILTGNGRKN
jgi:hypothetical protein